MANMSSLQRSFRSDQICFFNLRLQIVYDCIFYFLDQFAKSLKKGSGYWNKSIIHFYDHTYIKYEKLICDAENSLLLLAKHLEKYIHRRWINSMKNICDSFVQPFSSCHWHLMSRSYICGLVCQGWEIIPFPGSNKVIFLNSFENYKYKNLRVWFQNGCIK